jgi:hypothetical protein
MTFIRDTTTPSKLPTIRDHDNSGLQPFGTSATIRNLLRQFGYSVPTIRDFSNDDQGP